MRFGMGAGFVRGARRGFYINRVAQKIARSLVSLLQVTVQPLSHPPPRRTLLHPPLHPPLEVHWNRHLAAAQGVANKSPSRLL
jgi:hypothetical protein